MICRGLAAIVGNRTATPDEQGPQFLRDLQAALDIVIERRSHDLEANDQADPVLGRGVSPIQSDDMPSPVLLDIPESFETERLLIRVPRAGDGPELNAAVLETFEDLQPWMPWAKERPSVEKSEENSRRAYSQFLTREDITLRLIHKATGKILGSSGLHPRDWAIPKFEIGYWCRKQFQGQGYITEAVRGILRFGFETVGAKRIEVCSDSTNVPSLAVVERVGMKREGELRNHLLGMDGTPRNLIVFGLTDGDWQSLRERRSAP